MATTWKKMLASSVSKLENPKDVESWLLTWTNVMEGLEIPPALQVPVCVSYFQGYLAKWAAAKRKAFPAMTWDQLHQLLKQEFVDTTKSKKAQDELLRCRQRQNEAVIHYIHRFRKLVVESGVDADNDLVLRTFIKGIANESLRTNVAVARKDTFEEVVAQVTDASAAMAFAPDFSSSSSFRSSQSNFTPQRRFRRFQNNGRPQQRSFNHVERRFNSPQSGNHHNYNNNESNPVKRPKMQQHQSQGPRCYNCNQRGHIAARCLQPKKPNVNNVEEEVDYNDQGNDQAWS